MQGTNNLLHEKTQELAQSSRMLSYAQSKIAVLMDKVEELAAN